MRLADIREKPTEFAISKPMKVHESFFRSYSILIVVKDLLSQWTPHKVILDIIADLQNATAVLHTQHDK